MSSFLVQLLVVAAALTRLGLSQENSPIFKVASKTCYGSIVEAVRSGTQEFGGYGLELWSQVLQATAELHTALTASCTLQHYAPTNQALFAYNQTTTMAPGPATAALLLNSLSLPQDGDPFGDYVDVPSLLTSALSSGANADCALLSLGEGGIASSATPQPASVLATLPLCGGGDVYILDAVLAHTCEAESIEGASVSALGGACGEVQAKSANGASIEIVQGKSGKHYVKVGTKVYWPSTGTLADAQNKVQALQSLNTPRDMDMPPMHVDPRQNSKAIIKRVVGTDDPQFVNYDDPSFHAQVTGRVRPGLTGVCTGTLISENVVITAAHCFLKEFKSGGVELVDIDTKLLLKTVVDFEVQEDKKPASYPIIDAAWDQAFVTFLNIGSEQALQYDFMLLVLKGTPGKKFGFAGLLSTTPKNVLDLVDKAPLSLVAFSDFNEDSCVYNPCEQSVYVDSPNCFFRGMLFNINMFVHDCDDEEGASGGSFTFVGLDDKLDNRVVGLTTLDYNGVNVGVLGSSFYDQAVSVILTQTSDDA